MAPSASRWLGGLVPLKSGVKCWESGRWVGGWWCWSAVAAGSFGFCGCLGVVWGRRLVCGGCGVGVAVASVAASGLGEVACAPAILVGTSWLRAWWVRWLSCSGWGVATAFGDVGRGRWGCISLPGGLQLWGVLAWVELRGAVGGCRVEGLVVACRLWGCVMCVFRGQLGVVAGLRSGREVGLVVAPFLMAVGISGWAPVILVRGVGRRWGGRLGQWWGGHAVRGLHPLGGWCCAGSGVVAGFGA